MSTENRDMNRDPITDAPGAHPVGVGVGGAVGTLAGAAAGKGVAESIDPTGEADYWRNEYPKRSYASADYTYDNDYAPAYAYGNTARSKYAGRTWDDALETDLRTGWETAKSKSRLTWDQARQATRDAYDRSDRTYRTYQATGSHFENTHKKADYYKSDYNYETDYRPAYRYGTHARAANPTRNWDEKLETELGSKWESVKGSSRMSWDNAKHAARDAWHSVERALPGDADGDGR